MKWILRLINLEGESIYSEAMDIHGNRRVCRKQQFAEQFESLPSAEHGSNYFQLLWEFRAYVIEIVEIHDAESLGVSGRSAL